MCVCACVWVFMCVSVCVHVCMCERGVSGGVSSGSSAGSHSEFTPRGRRAFASLTRHNETGRDCKAIRRLRLPDYISQAEAGQPPARARIRLRSEDSGAEPRGPGPDP